MLLITENPTSSKILDESFPNRHGDYLKVLLNKAKIKDESYSVLSMEDDLKDLNFEVIVTLGRTPTGLLLELPKSFKMKDYVGKSFFKGKRKIVPWYSLEHLLIKGKSVENQTIELLGKINET